MRVSYRWLKEYINISLPSEVVADLLTHCGLEVEHTEKISMSGNNFDPPTEDTVFEIGLTPNRPDAASHMGIARDLYAVLKNGPVRPVDGIEMTIPPVDDFSPSGSTCKIDIQIENKELCPRYAGMVISGVKVRKSPDWLQQRLKSIGLKPINNIVDITNFVLHETGHPLHAFDAAKIKGNRVIVKTAKREEIFVTLDGEKKLLHEEDLMICNEKEAMCIAGVMGGFHSSVTDETKEVFLESAYFLPSCIRKSAKRHDLHTEASFRFERGADPDKILYAAQRAALLIGEIAGGVTCSVITDVYPQKINDREVKFSYEYCDALLGKKIDRPVIKNILEDLGMKIKEETKGMLILSVPPGRVDVLRPADIAEEVLRIYGCGNIDLPEKISFSPPHMDETREEKMCQVISDLLTDLGFDEIITGSLINKDFISSGKNDGTARYPVSVLNPVSSEMSVLRSSMLYGGLETIRYNRNRQHLNMRFFEFGHIYIKEGDQHKEHYQLAVFISGTKQDHWDAADEKDGFFVIKNVVHCILEKMGFEHRKLRIAEKSDGELHCGLSYINGKNEVVYFGKVGGNILLHADIDDNVWFASFHMRELINACRSALPHFVSLPKFPFVTRDLALLIDTETTYQQLEDIAFDMGKELLREVHLFDIYKADRLPKGKKSYALRFTFQDPKKNLTDREVNDAMTNLTKAFLEQAKATVR